MWSIRYLRMFIRRRKLWASHAISHYFFSIQFIDTKRRYDKISVSVQTRKESRISSSFVLSLPVFGQRLEGSNKTSRVPPPVALRGEWVVRHCALVAVLLLCEGWSVSIQKKFSSFYDMLLTAQQHNKGDDKTTPKRQYQTDVARHTKQCTQFSNTMSALMVCKFEGRGHALSTKAVTAFVLSTQNFIPLFQPKRNDF